MTQQEAIDTIKWTTEHLAFKLDTHQFKIWARKALKCSKKQWMDAVDSYYENRKDMYPPVLYYVTSRIKGNIQGVEVKHYEANPDLSHGDNYILYLEWRYKQ